MRVLLPMFLSLCCLLLGGGLYFLFVEAMEMDVADFMIRIPITFIFGTIIVQNMLERSLFASKPQPMKGVLAAAHENVDKLANFLITTDDGVHGAAARLLGHIYGKT